MAPDELVELLESRDARMLTNPKVTRLVVPRNFLASIDTHFRMKYIVVRVRCHKPAIRLRFVLMRATRGLYGE